MDCKRMTWLSAALLACTGLMVTPSWANDAAKKTGPSGDSSETDILAISAREVPASERAVHSVKSLTIEQGAQLAGPDAESAVAEEEAEGSSSAAIREVAGETCLDAFAITPAMLPFTDTGDTRNNFDNYEQASCNGPPEFNRHSKDVVYKYTPPGPAGTPQVIRITMCGTLSAGAGNDDTRLLIFEGDCEEGSEYACNDDAESGCPASGTPSCPDADANCGRQAEIPALEVIGGTEYFIVADGWNGEVGTYNIQIRVVAPGACCKQIGGETCSPGTSAVDCLCLAEKFTESAANCVAATACVEDPIGVGCPPDTVFGPGFDDANGGTTVWIVSADDASGTAYFDGFWEVTSPISFVSWWGFYHTVPGTISPGNCDKADVFTVTFYSDDCGAPGDVIAGPFTDPDITVTVTDQPGFIMDLYTVALPTSVSFSNGWVGIAAANDPLNPDCRHRITGYVEINPPGESGDRRSLTLAGLVPGDMMMCLSAPAGNGACCNDSTSTCNDNGGLGVPPASCAPPSRFSEGGTCAALSPACGEGACCGFDGGCTLTTQGACSGAVWKGGVACAFANCPPSNDTCNLVDPATGSLSYSFANRTNGATDDDCPELEVAAGWEAFGLADTNTSDPDAYSCYDVVLDYCGTNPLFVGNSADILLDTCCGLPSTETAVSNSTTARIGGCCRDEPPGYDGNLAMTFNGVPSNASWYYPVFSVGGSVGDYTLNVNAAPMNPNNIGDQNGDGIVDLKDWDIYDGCITAPNGTLPSQLCACLIDSDADNDVDLGDYAKFQAAREACTSCVATAPAEGEPTCTGVNDGCDDETPAASDFGTIACNQTVCGTSSTDDSDWYQFTVSGTTDNVTWAVTSESLVDIALLDGNFGVSSCDPSPGDLAIAEASGGGCLAGAVSVNACLRPGTYWVRVAPQADTEVECGSAYKGVLTCTDCTPTAPVGACCRAGSGGALTCTPNSLRNSCEAVGGNYQGDGSVCPCPAAAAGDECLGPITLTGASGTQNFTRSSLTSNATDPVNGCEINVGGPFAKDGSIWFRWRSGAFGAQRMHLDLCCNEGGAGDDTLVTIFPGRPTGENNNPAVSCPAIIGAGDAAELACDDDTCVTTGVGGADLCRVGTVDGMFNSLDYYILVEIYDGGDAVERNNFTLTWTTLSCTARTCPALPVCQTPPACPGGATLENEPDCGLNYIDPTNNGCSPDSDKLVLFQPIACGQTYCGETGNYTSNGAGGPDRERDRDWFAITLTEETVLTWTVQGAGSGATAPGITAQIWTLLDMTCDDDTFINRAGVTNNTNCNPVVAEATVPAGTASVTVFGRTVRLTPDPGLQTCGTPWIGTLTCVRGDIMVAPADACGGAPTITGAGRYGGLFGSPATQTPDGESSCDGAVNDTGFCDGTEVANDVYWKYTAACTGKVAFEVRSGPAPMVLSAHSACSATCDNELPGGLGASCSDFGGGPGGSLPKITLDVKTGVSYFIRLAAANDGPYELVVSDCITCCDPLPTFPTCAETNCPVCGNGCLEGAEECDDNNNTNGDGCDAFCRIE